MNERTQKIIYCLYDNEMKVVLQVYFAVNDISNQRSLSDFVNSQQCPYKNILDKVLVYKLGSYCEQTAEFDFFAKNIVDNQPLYSLKDFLIDKK